MGSEEWLYFCAKFVDQFWLHELVFVADVEGDHGFGLDDAGIFFVKPAQVRFFHDEDQIGPAK